MSQLDQALLNDPSFGITDQKHSKPGTFKSPAAENQFQKKVVTWRTDHGITLQSVLVGLMIIPMIIGFNGMTFSFLLRIFLVAYALIYLVNKTDLTVYFKTRSKGRPPIRKSKPSQFMKNMEANLIYVLVSIQEFTILDTYDNSFSFIFLFKNAVYFHVMFLENYSADRHLVRIRSIIQLIVLAIGIRYYSWKIVFVMLLRIAFTYLVLLKLLFAINKYFRSIYSVTRITKRWFDELQDLIDSIPYPIFVADKQEILNYTGKEIPFVKIAYFNLYADPMMKALDDPGNDEKHVNLLEIIVREDISTVIETVYAVEKSAGKAQTITIEVIPKVFEGRPAPISYKFELTVWTLKWRDQDVLGFMFNNDVYASKLVSDRFSNKYLKGLSYLVEKSENVLEGTTNSIMKYNQKQMDTTMFMENITNSTYDLWSDKHIVDNFLIFDDISDENSKRNFRLKILILNVVDLTAKHLCKRGVDVRLNFSSTFPIFVRAKMALIRGLFFNILKYLEKRLTRGSIDILCESDFNLESPPEDSEERILIKFSFVIRSPANLGFPVESFLLTLNSSTPPSFHIKNDFELLLGFWLSKAKDALGLKIKFQEPQSIRKLPNSPEGE